MLKRPELKIIVFLAIFILTLVALRLYLQKCDRDNSRAVTIEMMPYTISYDLSQYMLSYIMTENGGRDGRTLKHFISYLCSKDNRYTCVKPIEEEGKSVIAFSLMLPDNLESSAPVFFGFAKAVNNDSKERYALFFYDKKRAIIKFSESDMLPADATILSKDPDLYYSR